MSKSIPIDDILTPIRLCNGNGEVPDPDAPVEAPQACWMAAIYLYTGGLKDYRENPVDFPAGQSWSDHPSCVHDVIINLGIALNDSFPNTPDASEARGKLIGPHLFAPIGTAGGPTQDMFRLALEVLILGRHADKYPELAGRARSVTNTVVALSAEEWDVDPVEDVLEKIEEVCIFLAESWEAEPWEADASYAHEHFGMSLELLGHLVTALVTDYPYHVPCPARQDLLQLILDLCEMAGTAPVEPCCDFNEVVEVCGLRAE